MKDDNRIEEELKVESIRRKVVSVDSAALAAQTPKTITMTDGPLIPKKGEKHVLSSWRLTFIGAVVLLLALIIFKPEPYRQIFIVCIQGAPVTFEVTICAIIGRSIFPRAWWILEKMLSQNTPTLPAQQMVPYTTASSTAAGDVAEASENGRRMGRMIAVKSAHMTSASKMPAPPVLFAASVRPFAYRRDICVFTPTPVPTASAVIMS